MKLMGRGRWAALAARRERTQSGFSLIELLVTMAVLGVLAGAVMFAVGGVAGSASETGCLVEYRTIVAATEFAEKNGGAVQDYLDGDPHFFENETPDADVPTWKIKGEQPGCPAVAP